MMQNRRYALGIMIGLMDQVCTVVNGFSDGLDKMDGPW